MWNSEWRMRNMGIRRSGIAIPHSEFRIPHSYVARPERIELPTCWFEASRSIRLSYGRPELITDL